MMTDREKHLVMEFAKAVLHGDASHRAWLIAAAEAYCDGLPIPKDSSVPVRRT